MSEVEQPARRRRFGPVAALCVVIFGLSTVATVVMVHAVIASVPSDVASLLRQVKEELNEKGHDTQMAFSGDPIVSVRPDAFKRCVANLVANAQRHAGKVIVDGSNDKRFLTINVDDDGPGIPAEQREDVFKPFFRLDEARNQDEAGTGLGLAIARDIARSHGRDIQLATSPLGGLRATLRIPL